MSAEESQDTVDLLREMGQAADRAQWSEVLALADQVLGIDPDNADALSFRRVAERLATEADASQSTAPTSTATRPDAEADSASPAHVSTTGALLVGRDHEMAELKTALDETLAGQGRIVMLVGEPGIGETRLAEELADYAAGKQAKVLWGRSFEGEGAPAYWPWIQALRTYVQDTEPETLKQQMGSGAAILAGILPSVREKLPDLEEAPQARDAESARFQLFDAVTRALRSISEDAPLLIVLDDLHWSDEPALKLLEFLAHELRSTRH